MLLGQVEFFTFNNVNTFFWSLQNKISKNAIVFKFQKDFLLRNYLFTSLPVPLLNVSNQKGITSSTHLTVYNLYGIIGTIQTLDIFILLNRQRNYCRRKKHTPYITMLSCCIV